MSAPAYERIRDAAAAASSPGPTGATSPRLYSPAPAALTATVTGQSATPGGSQVPLLGCLVAERLHSVGNHAVCESD